MKTQNYKVGDLVATLEYPYHLPDYGRVEAVNKGSIAVMLFASWNMKDLCLMPRQPLNKWLIATPDYITHIKDETAKLQRQLDTFKALLSLEQ